MMPNSKTSSSASSGRLWAAFFGLLTGRETPFAWNIGSFIAAVIGAVVLLVILHLVRRARSNPLPQPFPMLVGAAGGSTRPGDGAGGTCRVIRGGDTAPDDSAGRSIDAVELQIPRD